jgi:hypothetical protein
MAKLLWSVTEVLLVLLAGCIWVASTAVASASGFVAMVATTLLPGISQVYWIWSIRAATGKVPEPMTMLCVTWLGLFVVWFYARHYALLAHDPEKCAAVFGQDHAQTKR